MTSLSTTNVIVQHVQVVPGKYTDHNAGHPDNEVLSQTTGQGAADFYRDGKVWHGRWSKPTDTSPTAYTVNGAPMLLAAGQTYVVLRADATPLGSGPSPSRLVAMPEGCRSPPISNGWPAGSA